MGEKSIKKLINGFSQRYQREKTAKISNFPHFPQTFPPFFEFTM